jgi:hypothetical protein
MDTLLNFYQDFYKEIQAVIEITLVSAVAVIQAVLGNGVQPQQTVE